MSDSYIKPEDRPQIKKKDTSNKWKWISFGVVGSIFAVSHLGMIGYIATRETEPTLPKLDIPVGPYTTYKAQVTDEGYAITYRANDPKTAFQSKDIKEKAGFLGLANNTTKISEEYFMDGAINQGGPVSNQRSWLDRKPGLTDVEAGTFANMRSEACIEAVGAAKGTGKLVGTNVGAAAAPAVSGIPFIGWVAAGWIAMFGGDQGSDIGGQMAEQLNKNC